jgi:hypothetical protein
MSDKIVETDCLTIALRMQKMLDANEKPEMFWEDLITLVNLTIKNCGGSDE